MNIKWFITKSLLFFSPLTFLSIITYTFYATDQGDLLRIGYIAKDSEYRKIFQKEFNRPIYHSEFDSAAVTKNSTKIKVLVIGDSFSQQSAHGYKNYLAESKSIEVTYLNKYAQNNTIDVLEGIVNKNFLDSTNFHYIILQSVERTFVNKSKKLNNPIENLDVFALTNNENVPGSKEEFPPIRIIKFPLYNILYYFKDNAYLSKTYRVKITKPLFSGKRKNELLFYKADLDYIHLNNDSSSVSRLNDKLNNLSAKLKKNGVKLIVLPSPDKYDLYYDYIHNKENYPRPLFFELMAKMNKDYIYVDSKKILSLAIINRQDIYFYDDTHWSPWAAQVIANELSNSMLKDRSGVPN